MSYATRDCESELRHLSSALNPHPHHTRPNMEFERVRHYELMHLIYEVSGISIDDRDALSATLWKSNTPLVTVLATVIAEFVADAKKRGSV